MIFKDFGHWLCFLALGFITPAHGDPTIDDVGHFVATFPGAVTHDSDVTNDETGNVKLYETMFASPTGNYTVSYDNIPIPPSATLNVAQVYQSAIQHTITSDKAKLRTQAQCTAGAVAGEEYIADVPGTNLVLRCRLFLVGGRLYQVIYAGFEGSENSDAVTGFLDSFRVLR